MRLPVLVAALLVCSTAIAQSRAGGLPQCEVELDDAYDAVEVTVIERDAALDELAVREVGELIEGITMLRIRKRPDLLMQEWDALIDESVALLQQNPKLLPSGFEQHLDAALARVRKRPDLLMQEWDALIEENLELLKQNPLSTTDNTHQDNVLFGADIGDL